jgi:multidrug resistance efflux pump
VVDGRDLKTRKVLWRLLWALLLLLCLPIRQFVIAPAEIISLDSTAVTSPVEGIVAELVAKPNQLVKKGDVLIRLDDTAIRNRLASARQGLEVSRAEYLAGAHRAFVSSEKNAEAGVLKGRINERLAEVAFLQEQLQMQEIRAIRDGIAVYGQENDWIGKPVSAGQRIMELAASSGRTAVALELDRNQDHQQHRKGSMRTCWWKRMPKVKMVKKAFDPEQ